MAAGGHIARNISTIHQGPASPPGNDECLTLLMPPFYPHKFQVDLISNKPIVCSLEFIMVSHGFRMVFIIFFIVRSCAYSCDQLYCSLFLNQKDYLVGNVWGPQLDYLPKAIPMPRPRCVCLAGLQQCPWHGTGGPPKKKNATPRGNHYLLF